MAVIGLTFRPYFGFRVPYLIACDSLSLARRSLMVILTIQLSATKLFHFNCGNNELTKSSNEKYVTAIGL